MARSPRIGSPAAIDVLDDVVAVAETAAGLALLDPAADAAMGLGGEVLQEERVHGAFQADMKLCDLALAQRENLNAGEAEMLEQGRDIGLVAAQAVQRLGQHNIEFTPLGVLQQRLHAGPQDHAGAGDRRRHDRCR